MKTGNDCSLSIYLGILVIVFLLGSVNANAQSVKKETYQKKDFKSKLFFGGGFGLQFGTITLIEMSPLIGYKVTPKIGVGVSPSYKYYKYKDYYGTGSHYKANIYGGSVFVRYSIYQNIFAHTEFESLFYDVKVSGFVNEKLKQYNSVFVGGGYQQNMGEKSGMYILVLWNLNDTPDSPYNNPVIRVGFNFGL